MTTDLRMYEKCLKQTLPAGAILLQQGKRSGRLYVLAEGQVEVLREDTVVAVIDEPGAMFGEMSALLDVDHTATVKAVTPVTVYLFADAAKLLSSDPEIALSVAKKLAERLNLVTTYLVDLKRQYAGQGNHLNMVSDVLASLVFHQGEEFTPGSDRENEDAP
jgi:CRP-like cAMP-binding protein